MMAPGPEAVHLEIEPMREPCEWVPVAGVAGRKDPIEPFALHHAGHVRIPRDVLIVVEVDELVPDRLTEDQSDGQHEQDADEPACEGVAVPGLLRRRNRLAAGRLLPRIPTAAFLTSSRHSNVFGTGGSWRVNTTGSLRPAFEASNGLNPTLLTGEPGFRWKSSFSGATNRGSATIEC